MPSPARPTEASSFDLAAIRRIKPVSDADALKAVADGFRAADIQLHNATALLAALEDLHVQP